jgi:predicted metal-binding protein
VGRDKAWKQVRADWRDVVLVCRKCAKKLDGGFGEDGDETLAKALRRSLDAGRGGKVKTRRREVAVVEVGCLDICPKRAVVALRASEPGRWILVPEGADLDDVAERLGLSEGDDGSPRTLSADEALPGTA